MRIIFVICVITLMCYFSSEVSGATGVAAGVDCKAGDVWTDKECVQHSCGENGQVKFASCGTVGCSDDAKLVEDKSKPYPGCCPNCSLI